MATGFASGYNGPYPANDREFRALPSMEKKDIPSCLGDFELVGLIGRGGMGVVYEARQRSLNRRVALKVLSSGLGLTEKAVTRFRREAEAAARLHHTNIVPIYATGEDGGTHYYAMEFIDGPSLDQVIRRMRDTAKPQLKPGSPESTSDSGSDDLPAWVADTMSYGGPKAEDDKDPKAPRRFNKRIPTDLETICLKAIERDPDRRYQTAGRFAEDLRNYVNRFAITAKRVGLLGHATRFVRRHPANSALLLLVLLITTISAWFLWQTRRSSELVRVKERVVEAILRGDFSAAQEQRERAQDLGASRYWDRFTDGQIQLYQGDYRHAADRLQSALELEPESVAAKSLLATANLWGGDEPAYFRLLKQVETAPATSFDDFLYLGYARIWLYPEASLALFNRAEEVSPNHNIVRLFRAQARRFCAMNLGEAKLRDALKHAEAAIREASISMQVLQDSPIATSEYALANFVASNICRDLADREKESAARLSRDSDAYLAVTKGQLDDLKGFPNGFDAKYARALILMETDDRPGLRELVGELDIRDTDENPYFFQIAGMAHVQLGDGQAELWFRTTPGLQGENCEFMGFFNEMTKPSFSLESNAVREKARSYFRRKLADDNVAYLEFDWCVAILLQDSEYAPLLIKKAQELDIFGTYREFWRYFSRNGVASPDELLALCRHDRRARSEANFYLGVEALSKGDRDGARKFFQQSLAAKIFPFYAHWWSRAFLARMNDSDGWPQWIGSKAVRKTSGQ